MIKKDEEEMRGKASKDPPNPNTPPFQMDYSKYQTFIEEVKNKNLNSPEFIISSIKNTITEQDSTFYNAKNNHFIPTKYPHSPLPIKPTETFEKFNEDTLFFIFFIQQDVNLRYEAAKELKKRGWMYNKKFFTFFQLQGTPKNKTEDSIEGKFKYFDYEEDWILRQKKDFKFEFKMLENID